MPAPLIEYLYAQAILKIHETSRIGHLKIWMKVEESREKNEKGRVKDVWEE